MRILHLIDSGGMYGAETVLLTLAAEQMALGMRPVIGNISTPGDHPKAIVGECDARGLPVASFFMPRGYSRESMRTLMAYVIKEGIEVIHTHGYKGDILLGFHRGVGSLPAPVIATVHGWTTTRLSSLFALRVALYEWLDGIALRRLDKTVAVSGALTRHPRLQALPPEKVVVVHNGIPQDSPEGPHAVSELDSDIVDFCKGAYVIGSIGRLAREKAQYRLIHAVHALRAAGKNVKLLLLGAGALEGELMALARRLQVESRVLMPGYRRNASSYLSLMSAFALPSLTEGLPIVVLEAMKARVPIVASQVGGIPEALEDGKSALLLRSGSVEELTAAIDRLMSDPAFADGLVAAASATFNRHFSSAAMAQNYLAVYRSLPVRQGLKARATQ